MTPRQKKELKRHGKALRAVSRELDAINELVAAMYCEQQIAKLTDPPTAGKRAKLSGVVR